VREKQQNKQGKPCNCRSSYYKLFFVFNSFNPFIKENWKNQNHHAELKQQSHLYITAFEAFYENKFVKSKDA